MRLQGKKIATLVAQDVEDLEYYVPLMRLQEEGAEVLTAALDLKPLHGKHGLEIKPDTTIELLNADELFALIVPGGWAPDKLRRHSVVSDLVRKMDLSGQNNWHYLPWRVDRHFSRHHGRSPRHRFPWHQG